MRPEILFSLFANVAALKGVGDAVARRLERLDITRPIDLLFHLPVSLLERRHIATVAQARLDGRIGAPVILDVTVAEHVAGRGRSPLRVVCQDDAGEPLALVFFSNPGQSFSRRLPIGQRRTVSGTLERYGGQFQIVHPDHILPRQQAGAIPEREPIYPLTEGLSNGRMQGLAQAALSLLPDLPEWQDRALLKREDWPGWGEALRRVHANPFDATARARLSYDELLASQLALALVRAQGLRKKTLAVPPSRRLEAELLAQLPFHLTGAQQRSLDDIRSDLSRQTPMLRLLQGDVGSGKTVVALIAMLQAVEARRQAVLLAPTEILARQHAETIGSLLDRMDVRCDVLTGRTKGRERAGIYTALAQGEIDILVGTHAVFQDDVTYQDLALVVIDEQHRFGVQQRLALSRKAKVPPHLLAMTATPIPRTLTLAIYGDMDVSRLDERPPGRQPIDTRVLAMSRLEDIYAALARALAGGGQAYWVCPLIEQSSAVDLAAAEDRFAHLKARFGDTVMLVHGRMKGPEKDAAMERFKAGAVAILVATSVIEVGVDVPNASLMVIEQAERFGLAQLHQLRGRVGRGTRQSHCLLLRGDDLSEAARARLAMMRETDDGFRLAEEDLRLRGPGELLGQRQSGLPSFHIADPAQDVRLLEIARDEARLILEDNAGLTGPRGDALRVLLYLFSRDAAIAFLRSG